MKTLLPILLLFSLNAFAEGTFHIWPEGMLVVNSTESSSESTTFGHTYQLHLGYKMNSKVYLGATMSGDNVDVETQAGGTKTTTEIERTFKGPTLGYLGSTYYILATYFVETEYQSTPNDGNTSTIYNGNGYQAEIGYQILKSKWALTFSMVYRSYTLDKSVNGGVETSLNPKQSYSYLQPYLGFGFYF